MIARLTVPRHSEVLLQVASLVALAHGQGTELGKFHVDSSPMGYGRTILCLRRLGVAPRRPL